MGKHLRPFRAYKRGEIKGSDQRVALISVPSGEIFVIRYT